MFFKNRNISDFCRAECCCKSFGVGLDPASA